MLSTNFLRRGYPLNLLEDAAIKARRLDRNILLAPKPNDTTKKLEEVILVTTYDPSQDILRNITKENWDYLGKSPITTFIHQKKIMVGYRRPKNLRDLLVKADCRLMEKSKSNTTRLPQDRNFLYETATTSSMSTPRTTQTTMLDFVNRTLNQPSTLDCSNSATNLTDTRINTPTRSKSMTSLVIPSLVRNKCQAKKACTYCPLLDRSGTITCHATGKKFRTKKNITCRSSNLVYCITCKTCGKQYVGQTKNPILTRFQGHCGKINAYKKRRIEEPTLYRQQDKDAVGTHFSAPDHSGIEDLIISVLAFITLPPQSEASLKYRLKVEKDWIHRMRCPAPRGLNILD